MAERTVIMDGCSKTWSTTGWWLGHVVAPRPLLAHCEQLMTNRNSCAVNFVQHAARAALAMDPSRVTGTARTLRERRDALVDGLAEVSGGSCKRPAGALFAFADVRGTGLRARVLADRLR